MMEDKALIHPLFTPCTDMPFSPSSRALKCIPFLPPPKRRLAKATELRERAEQFMEVVHLFLLFSVLPGKYYSVLTASQTHP